MSQPLNYEPAGKRDESYTPSTKHIGCGCLTGFLMGFVAAACVIMVFRLARPSLDNNERLREMIFWACIISGSVTGIILAQRPKRS